VESSAAQGNAKATLAIDAFVESCRSHLAQAMVALGGVDAVVFTGGIGENAASIRERICERLAFAGIEIDSAKNRIVPRGGEAEIGVDGRPARVWVMPTNEELVVARQTVDVISGRSA
jgi:acetate kinase